MKVIPIALSTHYATGSTTLARLWRVVRRDGQVYGFTDHDLPITYDGTDYEPSSAFDPSAIASTDGLGVDNLELKGLLDSAGITADDIEAGVWDGAQITVLQVNWADLTDGAEIKITGELGNVNRRAGQYVAEIRGLLHKLSNNIGRNMYPTCDATLGDERCGIDLGGGSSSDSDAWRVTTTVATVTDQRTFTVVGLDDAPGWFEHGDVQFMSGLNDGAVAEIRRHEVDSSDSEGAHSFELFLPVARTITPGDEIILTPGCDKTKATCIAKFDNVLNFRGFSFVPGEDAVLLVGGQ